MSEQIPANQSPAEALQGRNVEGDQAIGKEVLAAGYDHLFDPNYEVPTDTREAAVPPAQTSHRVGYWTKATETQITNAARYGFDLTKQDKYHS